MAARLPPLNALRAFEAAARLESFTRAAGELHVTHGAVSHQVRALEQFVGVGLFLRNGRRVSLTTEGRTFAGRIRAALRDIGDAAESLRRRDRASRLTVSVVPSFAARWLIPRLGRFNAKYPEFHVYVHASLEPVDFAHDDVDVAVRFGGGVWPGVEAEKLMDDEYFPVASPRLNRGKLAAQPADLAAHRLLSTDDEPWGPWFKAAGLDLPEPSGPMFNDHSMMLQAAIDGRGIALARRSLVEEEIAARRLVRLFDIACPAAFSQYVVWPKGGASDKVRAFREWIFAERRRRRP